MGATGKGILMRYWAIPIALLWIVLPSQGQDVRYPFKSANPLMFHETSASFSEGDDVTVPPAHLPVVDLTDPSISSHEKPAEVDASRMHTDGCVCDACRPPSGWNPYRKFKTWWANEAHPYLVDTHWGYDQYFHERPFGSFLNERLQTQITQGAIDQLVLYQYDFEENSPRLRPRGEQQLRTIAARMECLGQPLVIEATQNPARPGLDEARRDFVIRKLEIAMGVPADIAPNLVRVGTPNAFGLARGGVVGMRSEPEMIWQNQLRNTEQQGRVSIGGAGGLTGNR